MSREGNIWEGDSHTGYTYSPSLPSLLPHHQRELPQALQQHTLSPIWQESVFRFWCNDPPKEILYSILTEDYPISAQVLALRAIQCRPESKDLPVLWQVFLESRFGIRPEDPDVFSRALRVIIDIDSQQPNIHAHPIEQDIPSLLISAVEHRDGDVLNEEIVGTLLQEYYATYGSKGLYAFSSEGGSIFQEIIDSARSENPTVPQPPVDQPGQYGRLLQPSFHPAEIKEHPGSFQIQLSLWGIGLLLLSALFFRAHSKALAALLMSLGLMVGGEGVLEWMQMPTLAEQQPLFSFIDFSYHPYSSIERNDQTWWVSNGGASRWQEIPKHDDIFRIAVLGASSAHGSNLLQEESFSAVLERALQKEFPQYPIQVVNMGIGGTLSNGVLSAGIQAMDMGTDALIIYYGHNEVSQFQQLNQIGMPTGISANLWFSHLRSYTLLHNLISPLLPKRESNPKSSPIAIHPQTIIDWAAHNHHQNLSLLLSQCQQRHVPVLQVTPTYNFRFAPFQAVLTDDRPQAKEALEQAHFLRTQSREESLAQAKKVEDMSIWGSDVALEAIELQAHLHAELGNGKDARLQYQKLFDQSQEITTIHSRIKENIAALAKEFGTSHIDAEAVFYHNSADGITANGLFWDELHPSVQGHQYLAQAIIPWAKAQTSMFHEKAPNH